MELSLVLDRLPTVIPVAQFQSVEHAEACAAFYAEVGVPAIEVTLRSPDAWQFFEVCRRRMPDALVGVGSVVSQAQLETALAAADFIISPGFSPALCAIVRRSDTAYIPAVATASEVMQASMEGYSLLKFFPAAAAGGLRMLEALNGPFPNLRFCPTGGINPGNYLDYLALDNVACVGGSWVVPTLERIREDREALAMELRTLYPAATRHGSRD